MGMEDFWEQLPTGKEDKPLLFEMGPLEYDFHDIDGLYFMLDRRLIRLSAYDVGKADESGYSGNRHLR